MSAVLWLGGLLGVALLTMLLYPIQPFTGSRAVFFALLAMPTACILLLFELRQKRSVA